MDIDSNSPAGSPKKETGVKREISADYETPSPKRPKMEEVDIIVSEDTYSMLANEQYNPLDAPPPTIALGDRVDYYQKNIIIYYEQNKANGFPPELLRGAYPLLMGYCLHHKIFGLSLSDIPLLLQKTGIRLLNALAHAGTVSSPQNAPYAIRSIQQHSGNLPMDMQKSLSDPNTPLTDIVHRIVTQEGFLYNTPHHILSTFIDYAASRQVISDEEYNDCARILSNPEIPYAANCLAKLDIADFPEDLVQYGHPLTATVTLLMYCSMCKAESSAYTNEERFIHLVHTKLAEVVLSDMFFFDSTLRDAVPAPTAAALEGWLGN